VKTWIPDERNLPISHGNRWTHCRRALPHCWSLPRRRSNSMDTICPGYRYADQATFCWARRWRRFRRSCRFMLFHPYATARAMSMLDFLERCR